MDDVLELATKLSRAIARCERYRTLRVAEAAVLKDEEAMRKVREREELLAKLAEKEKNVTPIEPEEKRKIAALDDFVRGHVGLASLSKAQAEFQELLRLVNERITSELGTGAGVAAGGEGESTGDPGETAEER